MRTRSFVLTGERVQEALITVVENLPLDGSIEAVLREYQPKRTDPQNNLMWLRLGEIAEQAWILGVRYSAETWHEQYKREYLPDENKPDFNPSHVKSQETWRKWGYLPNGERVLLGSTTRLSKRGMSDYVTQIEAHGAGMGVLFSADPRYAQEQAAA